MIRDRSYRPAHQAPRRSPLLVIALGLLALIILVADQAGLLGPLRAQADTLLSPALSALKRAADRAGALGGPLGDDQALQAELAALREENSELKARLIQAEALAFENARLREQVRIEQAHPWRLLGADVAAITPDAGRRLALLAVGADQGVRPGMAVIAREGSSPPALIGVVAEAGPHSASVLLMTDYSSTLSAQVYRNAGVARGVVQGQWQRGSRLLLDSIDRDAAIAVGDTVVTAGLTAQFAGDLPLAAIPPDVPIGTIEALHNTGRGQSADVRPFVDPDRVRYAWVILDGNE